MGGDGVGGGGRRGMKRKGRGGVVRRVEKGRVGGKGNKGRGKGKGERGGKRKMVS